MTSTKRSFISNVTISLFGAGLLLTSSTSTALAANVPYLSLSSITGSSQVTVTVTGADPNVSALLYYPSSASYASLNIGSTNASGYLLTTIDASTYGIVAGAPVYVMVDGQQSQQQAWPSYTSSGGLSLSQTNVSLSVGQSTTITAPVSASLSLSNNTNPSVAGAIISGNQITLVGNAFGTSNVTVCASSIGCGTVQISVSSTASSGSASISFSQSILTLAVGTSQQITISGSGSYYISANSNSGVTSASISGSTLYVTGISAGVSNLNICSSSGSSGACGTVDVTVTNSTVTNQTTTTSSLTFSQSSVNLVVGQNQSVSIYGGINGLATYDISSNSAPGSVGANISGTNVNLTGIAFGGANIVVCQVGGPCGTVYAYVAPNNTSATSVGTAVTTTAPELTSFSVSSNDAGGSFAGSGSALTITLNANQTINTPTMTIGGSAVTISGSGSGPYTASYVVLAVIVAPIPINLTFSNPAGSGGQAYFWISNTAASSPVASATTVSQSPSVSCPAGLTCTPNPSTASGVSAASTGSYSFTSYLYEGMTAQGVADPDVTALQQRLKADGFFGGSVTGYFGPKTKAALKAYQTAHGLDPVGVVGPATRQLLNQGV